jgi:hypothetical protein
LRSCHADDPPPLVPSMETARPRSDDVSVLAGLDAPRCRAPAPPAAASWLVANTPPRQNAHKAPRAIGRQGRPNDRPLDQTRRLVRAVLSLARPPRPPNQRPPRSRVPTVPGEAGHHRPPEGDDRRGLETEPRNVDRLLAMKMSHSIRGRVIDAGSARGKPAGLHTRQQPVRPIRQRFRLRLAGRAGQGRPATPPDIGS